MKEKEEYYLSSNDLILDSQLFNRLGPIARVVIGSINSSKVEGAVDFFKRLNLFRGDDILLPESRKICGEEAEWTDARAVVISKIEEVVKQMKGENAGRTLVIANDVVFSTIQFDEKLGVWMPVPQFNLSRYGDQAGAYRQRAKEEDIMFYSNENGTLVCWDTAVGLSAPPDKKNPGLKLVLANRHLAILKPIPKERIEEVYSRNGNYKNINPRLDLVGEEREYIEWYGFIPMMTVMSGNGFESLDCWYDYVYWIHQSDPRFSDWGDKIYKEVNNGAPFGIKERVDQLVNYVPKVNSPRVWKII